MELYHYIAVTVTFFLFECMLLLATLYLSGATLFSVTVHINPRWLKFTSDTSVEKTCNTCATGSILCLMFSHLHVGPMEVILRLNRSFMNLRCTVIDLEREFGRHIFPPLIRLLFLQRSMPKVWFWRPSSSTGSRPASTSSLGAERKTTSPSLKGVGRNKNLIFSSCDQMARQAVISQELMRCIHRVVFFSFPFKSCFSSVGNRKVGKQRLSIGKNCDRIATIEHEFLHALGFWHEQSRADRDDYVEIMWDRISEGTEPLCCVSASWIIILFFFFSFMLPHIIYHSMPCLLHDIHLHVRLKGFSQSSHSNQSE